VSKPRVVYALGTLFHISEGDEDDDYGGDCYLFLSLGTGGYLRIFTREEWGAPWGKLCLFQWEADEEATAHLPTEACVVNVGDWNG